MTGQERLELLEELLRTTQVVRKNAMGNEGRLVLDGAFRQVYDRAASEEEIEKLLTDMFPYLFGPKSIMHALIRMLEKPGGPTGQDLYNVLIIAHCMDRTGIIRQAYETYCRDGRKLPMPEVRMCLEGLP